MSFDGIKRAALERITAGSEGARLIGSQLAGVTGNNVQLLLEALLARVLPSGGTTGQVLKKTSGTDYAASWQAESGGGATQPFPDNTALVKNNTDNTKLVRFDAASVATATTRVLTMPNSNVTLANVPAIASQAQADTGTDDTTIMTPQKVANRPQKNVVFETYISGLGLVWGSTTTNASALSVTSGAAWIPSLGRIYNVSSTLTGPAGTAFSASTWYHVYLYDNSGTPTLDVSTTAPVTYKASAANKTSDTSRRYLGSVKTNASSQMVSFLHNASSGFVKYRDDFLVAPLMLESAGTVATTEATKSSASAVPLTSRLLWAMAFNSASTIQIGSPDDGVTLGNGQAYVTTGAWTPFWATLDTSQQFTWKAGATSTNTVYAGVLGYSFER